MAKINSPILLHFAAGEVATLLGLRRDPARFSRALRILTLATDVPLYLPTSALWENGEISVKTVYLCRMLLDSGNIHTVSYAGTFDEFLDIHRRLYQHDGPRYPSYYQCRRLRALKQLPTTAQTEIETTPVLHRELMTWARTYDLQPVIHPAEHEISTALAAIIPTALDQRTTQALTYAYFRPFVEASNLPIDQAETILRRLIFRHYVQHYRSFDHTDIATGWPHLDCFDRLLPNAFPSNDIKVNIMILEALGFRTLLQRPWNECSGQWELLIQQRSQTVHRRIVQLLRSLTAAVMLADREEVANRSYVGIREVVRQRLSSHLSEVRQVDTTSLKAHSLDRVERELVGVIRTMRQDPHLGPAIQTVIGQLESMRYDVLLVTATEVETRAVVKVFSKRGSLVLPYSHQGESTYYDLGTIRKSRVGLVQSEIGASGPSGAQAVVADALNTLAPGFVIAVGIAFAVDPQKQQLSKVLVSTQILDYEVKRIGNIIAPRGARPPAGAFLLDRFRAAAKTWQPSSTEFGVLLSGDKLVDNVDFRNQIVAQSHGSAIGGEMEARGIFSSAERRNLEWIVVKAISDFADGKKRVGKKLRQENAAMSAARFVEHALDQGDLIRV